MNGPLLSIIIPTRNREYYCIEAIRDILSYKRNDFELCICDNSDSNTIEEFVSDMNDSRLKYQHIRERINFIINSDKAMGMANGEYVCMIGDDDTILPSIFEITEWAKSNNYENVTPFDTVKYYWPNSVDKQGFAQWQNIVNSGKYEVLDCGSCLNSFLDNGLLRYGDYLPRIYHGIIKKDILELVQKKTGHIVGGVSPDIYMSVTSACLIKYFVKIAKPFTVSGACAQSATGASNTGGHKGRLEDAPHLYKRGPYVWDNRIPKIYTVETIWGETAIKALEEIGRSELVNKINQGYFFAELYRKNRSMGNNLVASIKQTSLVKSRVRSFFEFFSYYIVKSIKKLFRKKQQWVKISNVDHITGAVKEYESWTSRCLE